MFTSDLTEFELSWSCQSVFALNTPLTLRQNQISHPCQMGLRVSQRGRGQRLRRDYCGCSSQVRLEETDTDALRRSSSRRPVREQPLATRQRKCSRTRI